MKVLFLAGTIHRGGAAVAINSIYKAFSAHHPSTAICDLQFRGIDKYIIYILKLFSWLLAIPSSQYTAYLPHILSFSSNLTLSEKPDILNIHSINGYSFRRLPRNYKVVFTAHDEWISQGIWPWSTLAHNQLISQYECKVKDLFFWLFPTMHPFYILKTCYGLKAIVTPSYWLKEKLLSNSLISSSRVSIKVIPNPIDSDVFCPLPLESYYCNSPFIQILCSCSYWNEWRKGKDLLIRIIQSSLFDHAMNIRFSVIGSLGSVPENIEPYIQRIGYLSDKKSINKHLNCSHLFILPSRLENLTQSLCESLAAGTPCIAFDVGGNSEIITNSKLGACIPPFNTELFIQAIKAYSKILSFDEKLEISASTKNRYSPDLISRSYESLFKEVSTSYE